MKRQTLKSNVHSVLSTGTGLNTPSDLNGISTMNMELGNSMSLNKPTITIKKSTNSRRLSTQLNTGAKHERA